MKVNAGTVHVHMFSGSTAVNGIANSGQHDGIVIFGREDGYPSVYIRWDDDAMRRALIYSLMTPEELERFTSR